MAAWRGDVSSPYRCTCGHLAGCQHSPAEKDPQILRISTIPDRAQAPVQQQHRPLVDRICAAIKKKCQWVTADGCEDLVERFGRREIDIANFWGCHIRTGVSSARPQLSIQLRKALMNLFLDLDHGISTDASALQVESAGSDVSAFSSDFDEMRDVLRSQGNL